MTAAAAEATSVDACRTRGEARGARAASTARGRQVFDRVRRGEGVEGDDDTFAENPLGSFSSLFSVLNTVALLQFFGGI